MNLRSLSVFAYSAGSTLWVYRGHNTILAQVWDDGYFNDAQTMMAPGDIIMAVASDGATMRVVTQSGNGIVTTSRFS